MPRHLHIKVFVFAISVLLVGCAPRSARRCGNARAVGCGESQSDLSGRWNETDAQRVADEMIGEMLNAQWLETWTGEHDDWPAIVIGPIRNKTMHYIEEEIFIKDIERNVVNSDSARFAGEVDQRRRRTQCGPSFSAGANLETAREIGGDVLVHGTIESAVRDTLEGNKVRLFYTVNLGLVDVEEKRKVWISEKEIKKVVDPQKPSPSPQSSTERRERSITRSSQGARGSQGC